MFLYLNYLMINSNFKFKSQYTTFYKKMLFFVTLLDNKISSLYYIKNIDTIIQTAQF